MEQSEVKHIMVPTPPRFSVSFAQGATKGVLGFKVHAEGENELKVLETARFMLAAALKTTAALQPVGRITQ